MRIDPFLSKMEVKVKCAVIECKTIIRTGDTYYLLGGGKVITCVNCACDAPLKVSVGDKPLQLTRGWNKTAVSDRLRKVM